MICMYSMGEGEWGCRAAGVGIEGEEAEGELHVLNYIMLHLSCWLI